MAERSATTCTAPAWCDCHFCVPDEDRSAATTCPAAVTVRHSTPRPDVDRSEWTASCATCESTSPPLPWSTLGAWLRGHVATFHGGDANGSKEAPRG